MAVVIDPALAKIAKHYDSQEFDVIRDIVQLRSDAVSQYGTQDSDQLEKLITKQYMMSNVIGRARANVDELSESRHNTIAGANNQRTSKELEKAILGGIPKSDDVTEFDLMEIVQARAARGNRSAVAPR